LIPKQSPENPEPTMTICLPLCWGIAISLPPLRRLQG